jgi:hypothetical protein
MKYLVAIGAVVILVATPLTVIAIGKSMKASSAASFDAKPAKRAARKR